MKPRNVPKLILAACYRAAYLLHHALCLRPCKPLKNSRLIVIGSYRAGGAGKTPLCMWLARHLACVPKSSASDQDSNHVIILCHSKAFDEVAMYKEQLRDLIDQGRVQILATGNRYKAACALNLFNYILCDDGFEDSRLQPDITFRLDWEEAPTGIHQLLPAGNFRSFPKDHIRNLSRTIPLRCNGTNPDIVFQIHSLTNCIGKTLQNQQGILVCGLGDPERFVRDIKNAGIDLIQARICRDHDKNFQKKIETVLSRNPHENIIISEKDSFRLSQKLRKNPRLFIARQSIRLSEGALSKISSAFIKTQP